MEVSEELLNLQKEISRKVRNIKKRKDDVFAFLPTLVVSGIRSVGKSTLLSLLVGNNEVFQHSVGETTKDVYLLYQDEYSEIFFQELSSGRFRKIDNRDIDSELLEFIEIVDLPGLDGDFEHITLNFFQQNAVNILIYIIDISKGLKKKDKEFLKTLNNTNTEVLFILNKIDMIKGEDWEDVQNYFEQIVNEIFKIFESEKVIGFIAFSAKNFANEKIIRNILRNVIIVSAYIQNFVENLGSILENLLEREEEIIKNEIFNHENINQISTEWSTYAQQLIMNLDIDTVLNEDAREKALRNITENLYREFEEWLNDNLHEFFEEVNSYLEDYINEILAGFEEINPLSSTELNLQVSKTIHRGALQKFFKLSSNFDTDDSLLSSYIGTSFLSGAVAGLLFGGIAGVIIGVVATLIFRGVKAEGIKEEIAAKYGEALRNDLKVLLSNLPEKISSKRREELINTIFKDQNIINFYKSLRKNIFELTLQLSYELLYMVAH